MAGYNHDSSHNKEFIKEEAVFLLESIKLLRSLFVHDNGSAEDDNRRDRLKEFGSVRGGNLRNWCSESPPSLIPTGFQGAHDKIVI